MSIPLFPRLCPKVIEPMWFNVDRACDDESEVAQLEQDHQSWLTYVSTKDMEVVPIGKTAAEQEEDEDDEEEDDNDDDDSESHDEEEDDDLDLEGTYDEGGSDVRMGSGTLPSVR